jgi:hypothetical protein
MVNELARADYSEWIAAVIGGTVETEFEANIFEYLSLLKDNRYLTVAIDRFVSTLNNAGSSGFTAQSNKDAFIIGALSLYIVQFPGNNRILRESLGQKANYFIGLSETKMAEIKGVPLNQAYIYLYLKYFGLEDLITKKMNDFIHSGERSWDIGSRYREWDRRSWNMRDVERLISYFSSTGKGMAQNFYTLFRSGFNMDDSVRIYIGLQVIKNIGFNDPDLDYWLNRISRRDSGLTITTTSYINGVPQPGQTTRPIVFSEEVSEVRKAVAGKSEVPFDQMLNDALRTSSKTGNFIPRVTAVEVVNKEVSEMTGQYTNTYISGSIAKWKKKNSDLDRWKIIEIITISVGCLIVLLRTQKRYFNENKISLVILGQILCVFVGLLLSIAISFGIASA